MWLLWLLSIVNIGLFAPVGNVVSLVMGQLIILIYVLDVSRSRFQFHVYQILLFYFYYSLCVTNAFSEFSVKSGSDEVLEYYNYAYLINATHFLFFVTGYSFVKYKQGGEANFNGQNIVILAYFVMLVVLSGYSLLFGFSDKGGYSDRFVMSAEEARSRLSIVSYVTGSIRSYIEKFVVYFWSNPVIYVLYQLVSGVNGYISSGIKAGVFGPVVAGVFLLQAYYGAIKVKHLTLLIPIGLLFIMMLIGSTSFRSDLSISSLLNTGLPEMVSYLHYFLVSPESSHIYYTADLIRMMDAGVTDYRYGFDYYRIVLYPIKTFFDAFGYASFVEYPHLASGKLDSQGQYLGLGGELYWNFGVFGFIFSFLFGVILKKFINFGLSLTLYGLMTYAILSLKVLWIYYRGIGNEMLLTVLLFTVSLLIFHFILRKILIHQLFKFRKNLSIKSVG